MKKIITQTLVIAAMITVLLACEKRECPAPAVQKSTTPPAPQAIASFTFQEDNDSIQTADSAYWYRRPIDGCAFVMAFKGTKTIRLFLSTCGNDPVTSGEKGDDDISGGFQFINGTDKYGIAGYHSYSIRVDNTNNILGSFNLNIRAYPNNTISSVARLKAWFSDIPFKP